METYEQSNPYPSDADQTPETVTPISRGQRRDVGAAAAGTAVLGAAAYGLSRLEDGESSDGDGSDSSLSGQSDGSGLTDSGNGNGSNASTLVQPVAQVEVNDGGNNSADSRSLEDMTFDEAFAAARHAQGPGHHFTWHGGLYNTFYQEELNKMSVSDRLAFVKTLDLNDDDAKPAPARPVASDTHTHHHHRSHQESPVLADNHEAPVAPALSPQPVMVVPMAAAASPEVVPISNESQDAHHVDLLTADHSHDDHNDITGSSIDSVDDHHDHGSDNGHADASGEDHEVHFSY